MSIVKATDLGDCWMRAQTNVGMHKLSFNGYFFRDSGEIGVGRPMKMLVAGNHLFKTSLGVNSTGEFEL